MNARKAKLDLLLTDRALSDVAEIERFSREQWGKKTATKYIRDIEAALLLLQDNSALLRAEEDLHPELRYYRVNQHLLVCDVQQDTIFVLTLIHVSRDIPHRLAEMQPTLTMEVELLHQKLARRKKR